MSPSPGWRPVGPELLADVLAQRLAAEPGLIRVAVDGPPCARPAELADALIEPLRTRSRPAVHVRAELFRHDASLRLEYGRQDAESYLGWLDAGALRREVLEPIADLGHYLPSLRDPHTNRSTREPRRAAAPATVLLVSGELLLGLGLPFDRVVHLAMSPAARARHTLAEDAWTLPAFERYDAEVAPSDRADIVIRMDDARHPAVWGL